MSKVTIHTLRQMKARGERITMLTAYDATFARLLDGAGIDALLVGDSLSNVVQGNDSTLPVTMDDMVYHVRAVRRGTQHAHLVGDMPFLSYQASVDEAVKNAGRLVAEGGAEAVKLEGGADYADVVARIVRAGIPVMGHIGLTPQSVHKLGGHVVQGRDDEKARKLLTDALALEQAGAYAIVLELIPAELAVEITRRLQVPTIGIGAGPGCDGQVLVCYDMLGLNASFSPKFLKKFLDGAAAIGDATRRYVEEVRAGTYPDDAHAFHSKSLRLFPAAVADQPQAEPEEDGTVRVYAAPV